MHITTTNMKKTKKSKKGKKGYNAKNYDKMKKQVFGMDKAEQAGNM